MHGFEVSDWSFHLGENGQRFEYELVLQAHGAHNANDLVNDLTKAEEIVEFRLSPSRN